MTQNIGIGFVTGRKQFQNVLRTYINNWSEHGIIGNPEYAIHLFIAYDLKYKNTQKEDYQKIPQELKNMVSSITFLGDAEIANEAHYLVEKNILSTKESQLIFGDGYAKKRNLITYFAIKNNMESLTFIDDDEYPLATMKNDQNNLLWMGQSVISTHLKYLQKADITHGHHCGYISPIPFMAYDDQFSEGDFKVFIEAISNDIINWPKIKKILEIDKGVTFADPEIINQLATYEVVEENGLKFVSGANLSFNLKNYLNLPPFYNPPGARGEDTFLATSINKLKVLKVPCYTFHDGFSLYKNILNGVLPNKLRPIQGDTKTIVDRFLSATIGWVRYLPLLVYVTDKINFEERMIEIHSNLTNSIPKLIKYFKEPNFKKIIIEFFKYRQNVNEHSFEFENTKKTWKKLLINLHSRAN